jgi:peptide/nickel transport system substrate-binding protein
MKMKKWIILIMVSLFFSIPSMAFPQDKTLVVGIMSSVLSLDPANHRDRVTETVIRNMFDGLVTRTPDGRIVSEIAESWKNPSPTVWEFKIRRGITFHNGDSLTAEDIKFTFDRIITENAIDGKTAMRKGLIDPLQKVEKIDDYSVRFQLSSPWPILLAMLPHQQIVPKKYLENVGTKGFLVKPVGAGPFKFVEGKLDERIVMERYDKYYGGSPEIKPLGPPPLKRVLFEVIPETATRIAALQAGKVHIIQNVPPHMVETLKRDPNVAVKTALGTRVQMFEMNVNQPPFNDVRVRRAMNHAVNMDIIVEKILGGFGKRMAGAILPNGLYFNEALKPYRHDPALAKKLLAEAGHPKGFPLVIDTIDTYKEVCEASAQQFRAVGIEASVRIWDWGVLRPLALNGERKMVFQSWGNSTLHPYDLLNPKLMSKDRGNYSQFSNPELDDLLKKGSVETNPDKAKEIYLKAQYLIYNEAPWVFGYVPMEIEACSKNVENWVPSSDSRINLHRVSLK